MLEESHIRRVVELVWNATLGLDVANWDDSILQPDIKAMRAAYASIAGTWQGLISIHLPNEIARHAAGIMFSLPPSKVTEVDATDALTELANQVAGNLKILLPGENKLSIPTVTEGTDFVAEQSYADMLLSVTFESGGLPMVVTLIESLPTSQDLLQRSQALMAS